MEPSAGEKPLFRTVLVLYAKDQYERIERQTW